MKNHLLIMAILAIFLSITFQLSAQVGINTDGTQPDPSAGLDVKFNNKGFLPPRLSLSQIQTISNPANGLQVFCTTDSKMYIFISVANLWKEVAYGTGTIVIPFSCGNPITDNRDGKSYNTIQIGTQCWFKENLNIGSIIAGSQQQINNSVIEKYCYNDIESNCTIYGGLYQWNEMMQYLNTEGVQGICPTDWHIPTDAEWTTIITFLGGESVAGGKMKSTGTIEAGTGLWSNPNTGATNVSGFTAVPAGYRVLGGAFDYFSRTDYWWSSSVESFWDNVWCRYVLYSTSETLKYDQSKNNGYSVRCLKN